MKHTLTLVALVLAAAALLSLGSVASWTPTAEAIVTCEDCGGLPDHARCVGRCNGVPTPTCGQYRDAGCTGWLQAPKEETQSKAAFLESLRDAETLTDDEPQQDRAASES